MTDGKRPGGLTALAVINFIFSGLGVITVMGLAVLFFAGAIPDEEARLALEEAVAAIGGQSMLVVSLVLNLITMVLLILSGIGYLKQKRFLGRTLGNGYALVSVIGSVIGMFLTPEEMGGGLNLGVVFGLLYPVLTLFLLNTTFKEDLVN